MPTAARKPPTPQQVQAEQERVRAADEARAKAPNLPSVVETQLPASSDGRSFHDAYLDAIAPASIAGKMLKFTKEGARSSRTRARLGKTSSSSLSPRKR
jgi:hypothetical protein